MLRFENSFPIIRHAIQCACNVRVQGVAMLLARLGNDAPRLFRKPLNVQRLSERTHLNGQNVAQVFRSNIPMLLFPKLGNALHVAGHNAVSIRPTN